MINCKWIELNRTMPPTEFKFLLNADLANQDILNWIDDLQIIKSQEYEGYKYQIPEPHINWIKSQFSTIPEVANNLPTPQKQENDLLDKLFLHYIKSSR